MARRPERRPSGGQGRSTRSGNPAVRAGEQQARAPRPAAPRPTPPTPFDPGALPADGAPYPLVLRNADTVWWRSMLGAVFGLSLYLLLVSVVSQAVVALVWALSHPVDYRSYYTQAFGFERPVGMLATNLGIATLIPISVVLVLVIHRTRARWLFSVGPGLRWRYLGICLLVALVALNGVLALSTTVSGVPDFSVQKNFWLFLVVIVLTSPFQAAAEELFFRGYLMQALGSVVAKPWFGVLGSSVVFALMHGTQNLPLFVDRLAFGLLAAVLVWRTGGLEAGIAAHVVNNVFAYLVAGVTTSIATLKAVRELTWVDAAFDVGGFALFAVLALLVARLMRLRNRVDLSVPAVTQPSVWPRFERSRRVQ